MNADMIMSRVTHFAIIILSMMLHYNVADATVRCRTNADCPNAWFCTGAVSGSSRPVGICRPNIILRQVCNIHSIVSGKFAVAAVVLAIAAIAIMFLMGRIEWTTILATLIGTAFIFGSFQFIALVSGRNTLPCQSIANDQYQ